MSLLKNPIDLRTMTPIVFVTLFCYGQNHLPKSTLKTWEHVLTPDDIKSFFSDHDSTYSTK